MSKTLYIYEQASPHVHDSSERYKGCVPLSESGIRKHFTVVNNPNAAGSFSGLTTADKLRILFPQG